MSEAYKSCAVMRNPFSTLTTSPKIPDGSVNASLTMRDCVSSQYNSKRGQMTFVLYPGFHAHLAVIQGDGVDTVVYNNHTSEGNRRTTNKTNHPDQNPKSTLIELENSPECPNQWRVVSQGLRLTLLNSSLNNDGYFEAIRLNPTYDDNDFSISAIAAADHRIQAGEQVYITPNVLSFENRIANPTAVSTGTSITSDSAGTQSKGKNWANHPSYITGRLRDLHKYTFLLKSQKDEHEFVKLEEIENIVLDSTIPGSSNDNLHAHSEIYRNANGSSFGYVDKSMDVVLIRVLARFGDEFYIHANSVQYTEGVYDNSSVYSKFMTTCIANKQLYESTRQFLIKDPKPGNIRTPKAPINIYKR